MTELYDDLKSNFRSWETACDNQEDADDLTAILMSRHPDEDYITVKDAAYEWVGFEENFDSNTDLND